MASKNCDFSDAFHLFAGGKGTLTYSELFQCLQSLGFNVTDEELRMKAGSGSTTLATFMSIASSMSEPSPEDNSELYEALRTFDKAGTGALPAKEFANFASIMGDKLSQKEVNGLLTHSKDGVIDYEALHRLLVGSTNH